MSWLTVCDIQDIPMNGGVGALIEDEQVAIFRLKTEQGEQLFALSNFDPFSSANVISRGLVGTIQNDWVVASPIYKQHFRLVDGQCVEDENVKLKSWAIKLVDNKVKIAAKEAVAA